MAKTTRQIIAQNKIKREKEAEIDASRGAIHKQQMAGVEEKNAARTLSVLTKAISGTSDSKKKAELSSSANSIIKAYPDLDPAKKTGRSATDTAKLNQQKKKEDRIEKQNPVDTSAKAKKERAQKEYENHLKRLDQAMQEQVDHDTNPNSQQKDKAQQIEAMEKYRSTLRAKLDHATSEYDKELDQKRFDADMEEINALSEQERKLLELYSASKYGAREEPDLTPLLDLYNKDRLDELERTYSRYKNEKRAGEIDTNTRAFVEKNDVNALLANVLSVPAQAYTGLIGTAGRVGEMYLGKGGYQTSDPYGYGTAGQTWLNAVRAQTTENILKDLGTGVVGQGANIVYQTAMTVADSIARAFLGGGAAGGAGLAATRTFSQTFSDASKQGASPQEAAALAVANSGIEYLTEKYTIDRLIGFANSGNPNVWKAAFAQAGIEITTEEETLFGSFAAELGILQEKSSYRQKIGELVANGESYDKAQKQVLRELLNEAVQTFLVSGLAGLATGGSAALTNKGNAGAESDVTTGAQQEAQAEAESAASAADLEEQAQHENVPAEEAVAAEAASSAGLYDLINGAENGATNRMADTVLNDPVLLEQLIQETGAEVSGSKAEQRKAVKEALNRLLNSNPEEAVDSAVDETPGFIRDEADYLTEVAPPQEAPAPLLDSQYEIMEAANSALGVQEEQQTAPDVDPQQLAEEGVQGIKGTGAAEETFTERQQPVTEENPSTVGAKESQFRHEVKQSKVYGNTYESTPYADIHDIGRAAKTADPNIDQYDVITEAESVHEAELRTETGRDRLVEHHALMNKDGWTGADNDTAMRLLTTYRREGKTDRFIELSRKQRQMATTAGQMAQSFAKYSREDAAVAVQDAIEDLDNLTIDQVDRTFWNNRQKQKGAEGKRNAFQEWKDSVTGSLLEIANDIENVRDGDKDSMKNIVRQIANLRHTTAWAGYSSELTRRTERGLDKMDFETLKTVAKTQMSMIPNDFRRRSFGEIAKAMRVQNMLFTLTTKFKNDAGNITTGLSDALSDSFAGRFADTIIGKFTGQRTVANDLKFANEYSKAATDAADVASAFVSLDIPMDIDTKYSTGRTRTFTPNSSNVIVRFLSAYEKHMKYALEVSDKFYEGGAKHVVNRSLESLGEKTGLSSDQIQELSQKVGLRRTFKDPGAKVVNKNTGELSSEGRTLARLGTGLKNTLNKIEVDDIGLGDIAIPFAAIPGELKQVGIDYTGGGIINGLTEITAIIKDAKNGKTIDPYRQRSAATNFGRGVTGAAMIFAFTSMAASGAIKVHNERDSEERMMNQSEGLSGAQMNLDAAIRGDGEWKDGDTLISFDFLEPYNTLMHISHLISKGEDVKTAIAKGNFNAITDMPMMQVLDDIADIAQAFTEVSDGDMSGVMDATGQLIGSVASGIVPNWVRKTAQIIDQNYRDTYDTDPVKKAGKEILAAIPFASKLLPKKYDNFGEEQLRYEDGKIAEYAVDNLLTPWSTDTYHTDEVTQEIRRLNAVSKDIDVTPPKAKRKFTYTDKNGTEHKNYELTDQQYETMQKVQGQESKRITSDLLQSDEYAKLTDAKKAEVIKEIYQYTKKKAEIAAIGDSHTGYGDKWMAELKQGKEAEDIIKRVVRSDLTGAMDQLSNAWKNDYDQTGSSEDLQWAYDTFKAMSKADQKKIESQITGTTAKYIEARDKGVSHKNFVATAKKINDLPIEAGQKEVRDIQKREAIATSARLTDKEKDAIMKAYMPDYNPNAKSKDYSELKYDYIREDLKLTPKQYVETLRIELDGNMKRADYINELSQMGYTREVAGKLYDIYNSTDRGKAMYMTKAD